MTAFQKIIKYAAKGFAIFLIVLIISTIVSVLLGLFGFLGFMSNFDNNFEIINYSQEFSEIQSIDIDTDIAKLNIVESDVFKVEASEVSDKFSCKDNNSKLVIKEKSNSFNLFNLFDDYNPEITVYIPEDLILEFVKVETGVGNVEINGLKASKIEFEIGVGKFDCDNLTANEIEINGGVGKIEISNSNLKDLILETGIGKTVISGIILGDSKITTGVGEIILNLTGRKSDYDITQNSGLGNISINDNSTEETISIPGNKLDIESGIGKVEVNFE